MKIAYLLFIGMFLSHFSHGQSHEIVIEDLRYKWMVYDEETAQFLPFVSSRNTSCVYFDTDVKKFQNLANSIRLVGDYYVFINSKLIEHITVPTTLMYDIDSLHKLYAHEEYLRFALYAKNVAPNQLETKIIDRSRSQSSVKSNEAERLILRSEVGVSNEFVTVSLVMLALIVGFRTMRYRLFSEYFSVAHSFSGRQRFELVTSQPLFSLDNLSFMILYALMVGATVYNLALFNPDFVSKIANRYLEISALRLAGLAAISAFLLILAKRLLVFLFASVFSFQKVRDLHFYTYARLSLQFSMTVFVLSILNGIQGGELLTSCDDLVFWGVIAVVFIRLSVILTVLNSQLNFHILQIIAYLCSIEIVPLVFFLKFFK